MRLMMIVLIPVYKGGALFITALGSVLKNCPKEVRVFISFNGSDEGDFNNFKEHLECHQLKHEININRTHRDLSAIEHAKAISLWLQKHLSISDQIMFLCHDDEIIQNISLDTVDKISNESDSICFPEWHLYDEKGNFREIKSVSEINLNQSIEDFIFDTFKAGDIYTNLTGIVCNYHTFRKYCNSLEYKKSGARTELMLATARKTKKIVVFDKLKFRINQSHNSAGANIDKKSYYYDEMHFMMWLFINLRILKYDNLRFSFRRFVELYKMYKIS